MTGCDQVIMKIEIIGKIDIPTMPYDTKKVKGDWQSSPCI